MTLVHIHRSGWFPIFLFPYSRYLEKYSVFFPFIDPLQTPSCFAWISERPSTALLASGSTFNAHVQAFYTKVHLVLLSHEPKLVLVGPSIRIWIWSWISAVLVREQIRVLLSRSSIQPNALILISKLWFWGGDKSRPGLNKKFHFCGKL